MMKRNSSTIPFGYKLGEDNKTLEIVDKEVSALKEMKAVSYTHLRAHET